MTTIYIIYNPAAITTNYVCDSQATIDAGRAEGYTGIFTIGTAADAEAILIANKEAFLQSNYGLAHFSQTKSVGKSLEGYDIWQGCDITQEPSNTDVTYQLFCDVDAIFQLAIGTEQALQIYQTQQQTVLVWAGLDSYNTLTEWPIIPKSSEEAPV